MYKVEVVWGEAGDFTEEFTFKTHAEAVAFTDGVEAAIGWMDCDWRITKDGIRS